MRGRLDNYTLRFFVERGNKNSLVKASKKSAEGYGNLFAKYLHLSFKKIIVYIFGGWLVAQKYLAGNNTTAFKAKGYVAVTSICDSFFRQFILVGDELSCYEEVIWMSHSTLTIKVEAFVHRSRQKEDVKITVRIFTFITIDR